MRTRAEVRNELDDLQGSLAVFDDDQADPSAFGLQLMRTALERRREDLTRELGAVEESDLVMVLDGPQVTAGVARGEQQLAVCQSSEGVSWLRLGLSAHGKTPVPAANAPAMHRSVMEIALAMLADAAQAGRNSFVNV